MKYMYLFLGEDRKKGTSRSDLPDIDVLLVLLTTEKRDLEFRNSRFGFIPQRINWKESYEINLSLNIFKDTVGAETTSIYK